VSGWSEKGIPLETGAVPAAVSLLKSFGKPRHCPNIILDGKASEQDEPEDLPVKTYRSFRVKGKE